MHIITVIIIHIITVLNSPLTGAIMQTQIGGLIENLYSPRMVDAVRQTKLDGQGKARHEAARRRNSECKINLSCRNSSRGNGSRPKRSCDWLAARRCDQCDTLAANHRCAWPTAIAAGEIWTT